MRHRSLPTAVLATVVAIAGVAAACDPGSAENLTDPREILTRTLAATAGLRTASVRGELQLSDPNNANLQPAGGVIEAQVDLVARELNGRALDARGVEMGRAVLVDETLFSTSTGGNGRWQQTPMTDEMLGNPSAFLFFGAAGEGGPDFVGIIGRAVQEPALRIALAGVEDCPTGRCYRTTVEIPADALWPLIVQLAGLDRVPGVQPPPPGALPQISLAVLSDTATLRLVELAGTGALEGASGQLRIQLSGHDGAVSIQPPPADLVDPAFGVAEPAPVPDIGAPQPAPMP
jgi:hypothetical protein